MQAAQALEELGREQRRDGTGKLQRCVCRRRRLLEAGTRLFAIPRDNLGLGPDWKTSSEAVEFDFA